jgi:hypothetical protein
MRARTYLSLRAEALAMADCGHDLHILEADDGNGGTMDLAALWINQGIADLWRKLVRVSPDRYLRSDDFTTTAGTRSYALATTILATDDFLAVRRIDLVQGSSRIPIAPFEWQEAPYWYPDPTFANAAGVRTRYRVIGQGIDGASASIYFDPDPGTNTYTLWYIQAPRSLSGDSDAFDGVAGFEDYVVCYAAYRMMLRQDNTESAQFCMAEMQRIEGSIAATAANRDVGRAPRIADVRPRGFR